jgi:hypothetical protein
MSKSKVYFDTNTINSLYEKYSNRSKRIFTQFDTYLSGSLLDELTLIPSPTKIAQITNFLWKISTKTLFKDKLQLMAMETYALLNSHKLSFENYFYSDVQKYIACINDLRKGNIGSALEGAKQRIKQKKQISVEQTRRRRKLFRESFDGERLPDTWISMLNALKERKTLNRQIYIELKDNNVIDAYTENDIRDLDYKKLRCTSIGLEYFYAFRFVTESKSNKVGKPERGDIYDNTHVYYAGLVDYFVTDDPRIQCIMNDLLKITKPSVLNSEKFVNLFS